MKAFAYSRLLFTIALILSAQGYSFAQCSCTDCPVYVPNNATVTSTINISGATNDQLGVNGQKLCRVCLDFNTDAIRELQFDLIAPNNSVINLFDDSGINVNSNLEFTICFVACSTTPMPDIGHADIFNTNDGWLANTQYTGTYHPFGGCLEDLSGDVNGDWTLQMEDDTGGDDSNLLDWYLVFADDTGLDCENAEDCEEPITLCEAEAGVVNSDNTELCPTEIFEFSVTDYNAEAEFGQYVMIVDEDGVVIEVTMGDQASFYYDYCGEYTVYSYNYELASDAMLPLVGSLISDYNCVDHCCDLSLLDFSFEDNSSPTFTFLPPHPNFDTDGNIISISCIDELPPITNAEFDDNCIGSGEVEGEDVDNTDPCLGGTVLRSWSIADSCNLFFMNTYIITIDPVAEAQFIDPPADITVDCDNVPFSADPLTYTNGLTNSCVIDGGANAVFDGSYSSCGGEVTFTWTDIDICGREVSYVQTITVEPSGVLSFIDVPADITVDCDDIPVSADPLTVTNGITGSCAFEDEVMPTLVNNYDGCIGEVIISWEFMDDCGNVLQEEQIVTIEPAPEASFIDLPGPITVDCSEVSNLENLTLDYNNGVGAICEISGFVNGLVIGDAEPCGNELQLLYEYTDDCNRTISHTQLVTVTEASPPVYIDVPDDITLECGQADYEPPLLEYNNGETGNCSIQGVSIPTTTNNGETIEVEWTYFDNCTSTFLIANQTVTTVDVSLIVALPSEVELCEGDSYDLDNLNITILGNQNGVITYHDGFPIDASNELSSNVLTPSENIDIIVAFTNDVGCVSTTIVSFEVGSFENVVDDGDISFCDSNFEFDLFFILNNVNTTQGDWTDLDDSGLDISVPTAVDLSLLTAGVYRFQFVAEPTNACEADTAIATITLHEPLELVVLSIPCSDDFTSYNVIVQATQTTNININVGTLIDNGDGTFEIINIPIDTPLSMQATDSFTNCSDSAMVSPPDCNCPDVPAVVATENIIVCLQDLPDTLSVNIEDGYSANWYDEMVGGTLLLSDSLSFAPDIISPGTYTYYVAGLDLVNESCESDTRTPIQIEVVSVDVQDTLYLSSCISHEDEIATYDLDVINELLDIDEDFTVTYFSFFANAESNSDPIFNIINLEANVDSTVFARVTNDNGCWDIVQIFLSNYDYPIAEFDVEGETCAGNSDGSLSINFISDSTLVSLDGGPFTSLLEYSDLDIGMHTITIVDSNSCKNVIPFEIESGLELDLEFYSLECFDNNTPTIIDDDYVELSFSIAHSDIDATIQLYIDDLLQGEYSVNEIQKLQFDADGSILDLRFILLPLGCELRFDSEALIPCSSPCLDFPDATIIFDPQDSITCAVSSLLVSSAAEANITYTWTLDGLPFDPSNEITDEGTLTLTATNQNTGCDAFSSIDISSNLLDPIVQINEPDTLDCDVFSITIDGSSSTQGDHISYQWFDEEFILINEASDDTYITQIPGLYYLSVLDENNGCVALDSIVVYQDADTPTISLEDTIIAECGMTSVTISAIVNGPPNLTINWTTEDGSIISANDLSDIQVDASGQYIVSALNSENNCEVSDTVDVVLIPNLQLDSIWSNDELCVGSNDGNITIIPNLDAALPLSIEINNAFSTDLIYENLDPGIYDIILVDANGCSIDTTLVIDEAIGFNVSLLDTIVFSLSDQNVVTATTNLDPSSIGNIEWIPAENVSCSDCLQTEILSPQIETYTIIITDINGCSQSSSIIVSSENIVEVPPEIHIPNAFSPDGNGVNDHFVLYPSEPLDFLELSIYDRWGELVYFNDKLHIADETSYWDGRYQGHDLNPGVYVYYGRALITGYSEPIIFYGDITLIR